MRNHHLITSTIYWGYLCSEHVEVKKSTPTVGEPAYAFSNRWTPLFGNPAFASRIRKLHRTMLRRIRLLADRLASVKNHFSTRVDTRHARSHFIAIEPFKCGDDFVPSTFAHAGAGSELLDRRRTFHTPLPCRLCDAQILTGLVQKKKISTIRVLRWQCASQGGIPEHRNLPQLQESVRTFRTVKLFFNVQLVHFRIAQMQWSSTQCLSWLQRRRIRPSKKTTDDPLTSVDKSTVQKSTCTLDRWKTQKRRFEKNSSTS